jgi:hypothetical protein
MLPIFGSSIVDDTHTTNTHRKLIKWACSPLKDIIRNLKLTMTMHMTQSPPTHVEIQQVFHVH